MKIKEILRRIRKYYNNPSEQESSIIDKEYQQILKMADEDADKQRTKEWQYQKRHDETCPHCGAKDKDIVNRIARVQGSGSVSGSFSLGFGSVHGSSSTDTSEVNHCNGCGNEWKKYKTDYKFKSDILAEWIDHIWYHIEGKYTFGDATVVILKNFHAESIWKIAEEYGYNCNYSTKENLNLSELRKIFLSVYDNQ